MDNGILNEECAFCESEANSLAGKSEMAEEMLWVENSVDRNESMKKAEKKSGIFRSKGKAQTPREVREEVEYQNEVYEEFSSDFDGLDFEDEANADALEAAADMHVECPYSHTAEYTMIADPDSDSSVTSTSQS